MEVDDFSEMVTSKTERVLHDHQKEFVRFFMDCVKAGHGCILADEMGLGKTLQSICAALYLYDRVGSFKCLICCPVSVLATWQDELGRFFDAGLKFKIYRGEGQERQKLQRTLMADSDDWNILLSTYEVCLNDKEFMAQTKWTCCIADEAHRLKNSSTQTFVAFSELPVKYWILLTGTPVQNNLNELYSFLRLIRPSEFTESGERKFVSRYKDIKNKAVMAELKSKLGAIMLRRTKMEVGLSIPTSSEVTLYHNITEMQKGLYKSILLRDRGNFSGLTKASFLSTLVQIRKCVCHPYLFEGVEPEPFKEGEHIVEASGKLSALDVLLNYLKRNGHRVLLFSQFVRVLDVVQDYLTYRGYTYERLDGSVRAEERFAAIDRFSAEKADTFVFLLSTRAGGLGLNLTAADTVIFYDSDWNPQNDLQAAARAHRIGQSKHVRIIRLVGRSTVEELILTKCGDKLRLADAVMKTEAAAKEESKNKWIQFLTYGLSDLMSSGDTDTEVKFDDEKLEKILGRTVNQEWVERKAEDTEELKPSHEEAETIYAFEGHDYTEEAKTADRAALEAIFDMAPAPDVPGTSRVTKPTQRFDYPELEQMREKAVKLTKERIEENRKRAEERKLKLWHDEGYVSSNLPDLVGELRVEDSDFEDEEVQLNFVKGDVTQPQPVTGRVSVIVHCADNSGTWPDAGVFKALSKRLPSIGDSYSQVKKMRDLSLGDAHVFDVDATTRVVVLIAQYRSQGDISRVNQAHLQRGLDRVAQLDRAISGGVSVHLPRLGYGTKGFDWYSIERVIRKCITNRRIPAFVYYYRRNSVKRSLESPTDMRESKETAAKAARTDSPIENPGPSTSTDAALANGNAKPFLPNVFTGVCVAFFNFNDEKRLSQLRRLAIAYNADTAEDFDCVDVTHVVVDRQDTLEDKQRQDLVNSSKHVVEAAWLEDGIRRRTVMAESGYSLH